MIYTKKDLKEGQYFNFVGSNVEYIIDKVTDKTITYHGANGKHTYTGFTITKEFLERIVLISNINFSDLKEGQGIYFRKSNKNTKYEVKLLESDGLYLNDIDDISLSLYIKREDFTDIALSA